VTGYQARVRFERARQNSKLMMIARVEEVDTGVVDGFSNVWNGDQTDWGLNFTTTPQVLRVRLAEY
jgi:hypothetical protein